MRLAFCFLTDNCCFLLSSLLVCLVLPFKKSVQLFQMKTYQLLFSGVSILFELSFYFLVIILSNNKI